MIDTTTEQWHALDAASVAQRLESNVQQGITREAAAMRLQRDGPNETTRERPRSTASLVLALVVAQLRDFMILVLLAAAVLAGITGDIEDALAIVALVVLNGAIGVTQSLRAERAMAELRKLDAPRATVVRGGERITIAASDVVAGDLVLLDAGASVPADLRLVETVQLRMSEAALTGESLPVDKTPRAIAPSAPLADRTDMAFMGTSVAFGRGSGIVVATGMHTELGKVAALLMHVETPPTPLQRRLALFGRQLGVAIAVICVLFFAVGVLSGESVMLMLLTSVSLAVAAIPEALPTVLTVMLALGAHRLARRNALVRKLSAIETLGSVSHVCTDKTGTLTINEMRVVETARAGRARSRMNDAAILSAAALACDADQYMTQRPGDKPLGDPTEVAIRRAARDAGFDDDAIRRAAARCFELPFDSDRMRMTVLYRTPSGIGAYMKGAPETVVARCDSSFADEDKPLDRAAALALAAAMASDGQRVLAVSRREWTHADAPSFDDAAAHEVIESGHALLGFVGMQDPPRPNAKHAVEVCKAAGIVPVMITGDHPVTARAIAQSLGIVEDDKALMTGAELDALSDEALAERIEGISVFARLDPRQKIRIVGALQARGRYVAVTGDGINDAPALARADIGVAMGRGGTDVAREAASIVLLDDDFSTMVAGIEEGRRILDNVRKFIRYALTGNSAELCVVVAAPLFGLPLPLLPIQILWINFVTDGLPGLALAAERSEPDIMRRPPRPPGESLFAGGMWQRMVWVAIAMSFVTLVTQACAMSTDQAEWQTMTFTVLSLSQMGYVLALRSERQPVMELGVLSNRPLAGAVGVTIALQIAAIYVPFMNEILRTSPLDAAQLAACLAMSCVVFGLVEMEKYLRRHAMNACWTN